MRKFFLVMLMTWLFIKPSSAQVFDFTLNDCNGVSHHLYEDLAAGNAVVMKFCTGWCGPCTISNPSYEPANSIRRKIQGWDLCCKDPARKKVKQLKLVKLPG